jgi:fructoselysine-6-P-deglycase FrlB-like protein
MTETITPFESDIIAQPGALVDLANAPRVGELDQLAARPWDRIVLTGMGSSHFVGMPTWRSLVAHGHRAWWVDAGQLLETPDLITKDTLVIATSQSGASGELVELTERLRSGGIDAGALVGITADSSSPLALASDVFLPLHSGEEATVSTKSYLNSLGVHRQLIGAFAGEPRDASESEIRAGAALVSGLVGSLKVETIAEKALSFARPRLASVGWGNHATTALYAALITKESSKVAIEGFVGGQFRHGPYELAGEGLTVFVYGAGEATSAQSLGRLTDDLNATGASTIVIGDARFDGSITLTSPSDGSLLGLIGGAVVAELVAVQLAKVNGVVPGAFAYGSKITTAL